MDLLTLSRLKESKTFAKKWAEANCLSIISETDSQIIISDKDTESPIYIDIDYKKFTINGVSISNLIAILETLNTGKFSSPYKAIELTYPEHPCHVSINFYFSASDKEWSINFYAEEIID